MSEDWPNGLFNALHDFPRMRDDLKGLVVLGIHCWMHSEALATKFKEPAMNQ